MQQITLSTRGSRFQLVTLLAAAILFTGQWLTLAADAPATKPSVIRIKAGATTQMTDSAGNVWLADQGFADGEVTDREADMVITNTKDPAFYRSEHYSMTAFSWPLPNGKYTVKLHFAETYDEVAAKGDRVFTMNVEGKEFKDFDVMEKAGGVKKAYIETIPVEITDGKLDITFNAKAQNPEINGIEIIPGS